MGHPQGPLPLQFDKKCAHGILTEVLKQKNLKVWTYDYTVFVIDPQNKKIPHTLETRQTQPRRLPPKTSPR